MKNIALTIALLSPVANLQAGTTDSVQTAEGVLKITPVTHGSLMLEYKGKVIHIDPWGRGDYTGLPKADLILITDIHGDHLDPAQVKKLKKSGTQVVAPQAVAQTVTEVLVLQNGQKKVVAGLQIEAVAMYNHKRGPSPGKLYHDKGRGNGYVVTLGDKRVYISGDTACISEMKALTDIDIAFVTMNLPYTMPPEEAAECVKAFKPRIVYPYHYRGSDLNVFTRALEAHPDIEVRLRDWY